MTPWLGRLLGIAAVREGESVVVRGTRLTYRDGTLRSDAVTSAEQQQTEQTFGFKWHQRDSFESDAWQANARRWLLERYGDVSAYVPAGQPLVVDAGCGAAVAALHLFAPVLDRIRYLGVDVSAAVDVARQRCAPAGVDADFLQCDLNELPLAPGVADVVFSEGVLHHTDSTERGLRNAAALLRPGGVIMFYVYRRKGPIREFTDDYIRAALRDLPPQQAWDALMPLTKLGRALGELDVEVDVPEPIDLLGIPAGRINLQRLVYWHVFKAFYRPEFTVEEMNHVNFDWYAPANAQRQSPEDVRRWCAEAGLRIEREVIEDAGITVIAKREDSRCAA